MKDVDTMVNYVKDGNDEKLAEKIHLVSKIISYIGEKDILIH